MADPEIQETGYKLDGALTNTFQTMALLKNSNTGVGTSRDKSQSVDINTSPRILDLDDRIGLVRGSRIARRAVFTYPKEAASRWVEWTLGSSKRIRGNQIDDYCDRLLTGSLRSAFRDASIEARWHGDGYILLGIDDGKEWNEPVAEESIKSLRWVEPLLHSEVFNDRSSFRRPQFYEINRAAEPPTAKEGESTQVIGSTTVHRSRILHFTGDSLMGDALNRNGGRNDSVLQTMFSSFAAFFQGLMSSSAMLTDHSIFTYKLKGLAKLIENDEKNNNSNGMNALMARFLAMQMGMSVSKGLAMDAESEDASFIQRNYAGVQNILSSLEDQMIAASDLPRFKLVGSARSGNGIGNEGRGEQDRYEWASLLHSWQEENWRDPLQYCQRIILLAKDGPSGGRVPDGYGLSFPSTLQLTRKEEAELKELSSATRDRDIKNGTITNLEARNSAYGSQNWTPEITLDPEITEQMISSLLNAERSQPNPSNTDDTDDTDEVDPRLKKTMQTPPPWKENSDDRGEAKPEARADDSTPAQKIIEWQGLKIGLQYLPFQQRHGRMLTSAYGHFQKTKGADGMAVDVYVGSNIDSPLIYAIDQHSIKMRSSVL